LKHIQFRFELSWLENPDFFTAVKKLWSKPCRAKLALDKIQQKLKILKQYFKRCGFNLQGELRKKRELISEELVVLESTEESDGLDSEQTLRKVELTKESLQLLD
jgi:Zn-dependent oligopeptidase